jgi:Polyketide cyclase / dehydrase and lipid transport
MGSFEVTRRTTIDAPAPTVHALIEDFHEWQRWSPWEEIDPDMRRTHSGAPKGVGARYAWSGNRKAGAGSMDITAVTPERIVLDLAFSKPFKAENVLEFTLRPVGPATEVTWRMTGQQRGLMALFGKVVPMDRLVGKDFDKGLRQLKAAAEQR